MAVRDVVQAAAGIGGGDKLYAEDVFSTYLYTGNGSTKTITNGIDLAGEGGMVWIKSRSGSYSNRLFDTERGVFNSLASDTDNDQTSITTALTSFNSNGFSLGDATSLNFASYIYSSWTFRKAPKFFDVVTYTGTGSARTVAHSLGSTPGCIIVKEIDGLDDWFVYHTSIGATKYLLLNTTGVATTISSCWNNTAPTSTEFTVGSSSSTNQSGRTYVAYLFAHDAGGFGGDGLQDVISCGSYTTDGSGNATVDLGWEPQFVLVKNTGAIENWVIGDSMRGATAGASSQFGLKPNTSDAETLLGVGWGPTATGFNAFGSSGTYIYIAIRRPMKTPESGTEVFQPVAYTATNVDNRLVETGIVTDMVMARARTATSSLGFVVGDRLRGDYFLGTAVTNAEATDLDSFDQVPNGYGNAFSMQNGFGVGNDATRLLNYSTYTEIAHAFKRAPGFFDVVCYTGDGTDMTLNHNLGVVPELMFVKRRSVTGGWFTYSAGTTTPNNYYLQLQSTAAQANAGSQVWNNTATTFLAVTGLGISAVGQTYVAYLFASCPGVSKVGSYTGTGTTNQINCGFTAGARFVLIKRTDDVGNWYVWDSARGIVSGNDPYLLLNLTLADNTSTDYVDTYSAGFEISSTAPAAINASGGSFIFLAIA